MSPAYFLYQLLGWVSLPLVAPLAAARALRDPRYRVGWGERFGSWWPVAPGGIWLHGASVGEIGAAAPLVRALGAAGVSRVLSTTSPAGRDAAQALLGPGETARLLPLDLGPLMRRALRAARPAAVVVVETELWPALINTCASAGVPLLLVNGRISDRSLPRYRKARRWLAPLLEKFYAILAQSELDAERLRELGGPNAKVEVGGNLKFDLPMPDPADPLATALRHTRADGWRALVAGSTHPGEESAVREAADQLAVAGHKVGLVIAPRHLERVADAAAALTSEGRAPLLWSELPQPPERGILQAFREGRAVLVDRYGVLGSLYGGADVAFVGGSLAPVGGHNLLEPLNWGVPVLFGPHTQNAREIRDQVLARGLGVEVTDAEALGDAVGGYLGSTESIETVRRGAAELFAANRGAVERAMVLLRECGALGQGG